MSGVLGGQHDQVDVVGRNSRGVHRLARCMQGQVRSPLVLRRHEAAANTCAREDPLVAGIDALCDFSISQ